MKVIWTREEDIQHDMYRPYYYDRLTRRARCATASRVAWTHRIAGSSIIARCAAGLIKDGIDPDAVEGAADLPYDIGEHARRVGAAGAARHPDGVLARRGLTRNASWSRASSTSLRLQAKQDPLAYRLALLGKQPALQGRAARSRRRRPAGASRCRRGRAAASRCALGFGSFIAQVVEVASTRTAASRVHARGLRGRLRRARSIPTRSRAQIESGDRSSACRRALYGEITIKDGRVEQTNFGDYRVLRINEAPSDRRASS